MDETLSTRVHANMLKPFGVPLSLEHVEIKQQQQQCKSGYISGGKIIQTEQKKEKKTCFNSLNVVKI